MLETFQVVVGGICGFVAAQGKHIRNAFLFEGSRHSVNLLAVERATGEMHERFRTGVLLNVPRQIDGVPAVVARRLEGHADEVGPELLQRVDGAVDVIQVADFRFWREDLEGEGLLGS